MPLAGRRPEIFNTDQGAQFTSERFTGRLYAAACDDAHLSTSQDLDDLNPESVLTTGSTSISITGPFANMQLSRQRAEAVLQALVTHYGSSRRFG